MMDVCQEKRIEIGREEWKSGCEEIGRGKREGERVSFIILVSLKHDAELCTPFFSFICGEIIYFSLIVNILRRFFISPRLTTTYSFLVGK